MVRLLGGYTALFLTVAMALAGAAALLWAWGREPRAARTLIIAAVVTGGATLIRLAARTGQRPFSSAPLAMAAVGLALGGWSAVFVSMTPRRAQLLTALLAAIGLAVYRWLPAARGVGASGEGLYLALAETGYVLSAGALLWGGLADVADRALRLAWVLQGLGLILQSVGAQTAWGAYWSWDPAECWRLAAWLVLTLASLGLTIGRRTISRTRLALWASAGVSLGVLLGSYALVRWLGLASLYIAQ